MHHSLTNHVVALAQLQAGSHPLGFDCSYRAQENLQTNFKNQIFPQYHAAKHVTQSPASTVSDRSDHSDESIVSENSSQTEYSETEDSPSANDCVSNAAGTGCGSQNLSQPVTSSLVTESQSKGSAELDLDQCVSATCDEASRSTTLDGKYHEPNQLAYRTRIEGSFEIAKSSSCINDGSRDLEPHFKIESCHADKSSHASAPRCYPSLLKPFTGFASTRSTPTESPQHVQLNSRRRPANPVLVPPKLRRDTDNTDAIVRMIVIFCTNLIQSIWPVDNTSGASASACPSATSPGSNVLPLQVFITETLRRSKTSYSTLQIALFYLILLKQCLPELANPGQGGQTGCRAMLCGRRMFLTALILASKYLQDRNYSARAWSKISGLPMKEINDNERRYLRFVGWDLHVPKDAFENWSKIVLAICRLSTGQDFGGQDPNNQPPAPPAPCITAMSNITRRGQLQDMCPDSQMYAVRAWWIFNLQSLRTDVVRCPRKTEQYVLSIPQLKGSPTLTRPLFEHKGTGEAERNYPEQEVLPPLHNELSKHSSIEFMTTTQSPVAGDHTPGISKIMPPPPPTLGTLPTPQTTPRSDTTSPYGAISSRSTSRCRDSASLLRGLDRSCLGANVERLPMPRSSSRPPSFLRYGAESRDLKSMISQPSPGSWLPPPFKARDYFQTPDASLTSSPESTVSDLSFMSGFVGRSRTSSFSSTSSRSNITQLSAVTSDPVKCEGFKKQLNSIDAQIAPRVYDWSNTNVEKGSGICTPQPISRPQTAFRTSLLRPDVVDCAKSNSADSDSDSVADEGYWSSDYSSQAKREERKRQNAAQALVNMQLRASTELTPTTLKDVQAFRGRLPRPVFTRSSTQVYAPFKPSATTQHTLKRSRSESFDHGAEPYLSDLSACNLSHAHVRNVQQSCQPWADSKQPVLCGTQDMSKRIAVESAAATRASADLRREACSWSALYNTISDGSKINESIANDCDVDKFLWQPCGPHVQEVHL